MSLYKYMKCIFWGMGIFIFMELFIFPEVTCATQKVYSPYVEKGELEVEIRGSVDNDERISRSGVLKQKYAIGYGFTDIWFSEVYGEIEKERNDADEDFDMEFTKVEWENKFQLTPEGKYPVDLGFLLEYAISTESKHPDSLEAVVLLGRDIGKTTHYANLIFEREVGGGHSDEIEGELAWSSRYRLNRKFEPGWEYHAKFGGLSEGEDFDEQTHQVGPAIYGEIGNISYDLGYLFGISDAAPQGSFKWILEYEIKF